MEENPIQTISPQQSCDLPIDKQTLANNLTEIEQKRTKKTNNANYDDLKGQNVYDDQQMQKPIRRESKVKALDCIEQVQNKERAPIQIKIANPIMKHKKTLSSSKKLQIQESKNITLNQGESVGQRFKQKEKQQEETRKGKIIKNIISNSQQNSNKLQKGEQENIAPQKSPSQLTVPGILHKEQHEADKKGLNCSSMSTPQTKSYKSIKQNDDQFDKLSRKSRQTFRSSYSSCEDYLSHVFDYYCKISYAVGKDPTFDQINSKMQIMTITNFMIFCKDFQLRECFERQRLVEVFKKNSDCQKYMNSSHFHSAIQNLSQLLYSSCEQNRRFGKMLVYLKIHNSHSFVKKMNDLGVSFRMKNKRGVQVNLTPKYHFKLTMNNGKTLQHIQLQVKQRSQIRKLLKQEHIQWHKRNRLNKIDELYKNGAKNNKKDKIPNQLSTETQKNPTNANNDLKSLNSKKKNGYYNPCEMLSLRRQPTYKKINELKKMNSIGSRLIKQQTDRVYDDCKLGQSNKNIVQQSQSQSREMKISSIIKMAKNVILQEKGCNNTALEDKYSREKTFGSIKKQILESAVVRNNCNDEQKQNNNFKDTKQHGSIKHQIIGDTTLSLRQRKLLTSQKLALSESKYFNEIYPVTNANSKKVTGIRRRNTKQLKQEEYLIEQQLRNIPQTINESKIKPKDYLRATAKIQQQYQKQLYDLQEMIGVFSDNDDQILVKHFMMERKQELELYHARESVNY